MKVPKLIRTTLLSALVLLTLAAAGATEALAQEQSLVLNARLATVLTPYLAVVQVPTSYPSAEPEQSDARRSTCRCTAGGRRFVSPLRGGPIPPDSGPPAHWWVGSTGRGDNLAGGDGGCRECTSIHCDEPSVPHAGSCPTRKCGDDPPETLLALSMLEAGDVEWLVRHIETKPERYGFDTERFAFQAFGCNGDVVLYVTVGGELAAALQATAPR